MQESSEGIKRSAICPYTAADAWGGTMGGGGHMACHLILASTLGSSAKAALGTAAVMPAGIGKAALTGIALPAD